MTSDDATPCVLAEQFRMLVVEYVERSGLLVWRVVEGLELHYFGEHAWWIWEGRPMQRAVVALA